MSRYINGIVKFWDDAKGWGFIVRLDAAEEVFVHWSGIVGRGRRGLVQGQRVKFIPEPTNRGLEARHVHKVE